MRISLYNNRTMSCMYVCRFVFFQSSIPFQLIDSGHARAPCLVEHSLRNVGLVYYYVYTSTFAEPTKYVGTNTPAWVVKWWWVDKNRHTIHTSTHNHMCMCVSTHTRFSSNTFVYQIYPLSWGSPNNILQSTGMKNIVWPCDVLNTTANPLPPKLL